MNPLPQSASPTIKLMRDAASERQPNPPPIEAWSVSFSRLKDLAKDLTAAREGKKILRFDAEEAAAILAPISWSQARNEPIYAPNDAQRLTLIWAQFETAADISLEKELDAWISDDGQNDEDQNSHARIARASIRAARACWRGDKAVIFCDKELIDAASVAVLRFMFVQKRVCALESEVRAFWSTSRDELQLTPQFSKHHPQNYLAYSDRLAQTACRMKAEYLRLSLALEQNDLNLSDASKRLFEELVVNALVQERLALLDDPIQYILDRRLETHGRWFDFVNSLKDQKYYVIEIFLEITIIILLLFGLWKNI